MSWGRRICDSCGANLDPQESCDCKCGLTTTVEPPKTKLKYTLPPPEVEEFFENLSKREKSRR